jgi:uncharacterized protein (DUF2344 family)
MLSSTKSLKDSESIDLFSLSEWVKLVEIKSIFWTTWTNAKRIWCIFQQIEVLSQENEEKKMLRKEISHTKKQNLYKRPKHWEIKLNRLEEEVNTLKAVSKQIPIFGFRQTRSHFFSG